MRKLFIIFSSAYLVVSMWALRCDARGLIFAVGLYSFAVYWAYGYQWSSGTVPQTKRIVILRKSLLLFAYISFNVLAVYWMIYGGLAQKVSYTLWLLVTSVLLYFKWMEMKPGEAEPDHEAS